MVAQNNDDDKTRLIRGTGRSRSDEVDVRTRVVRRTDENTRVIGRPQQSVDASSSSDLSTSKLPVGWLVVVAGGAQGLVGTLRLTDCDPASEMPIETTIEFDDPEKMTVKDFQILYSQKDRTFHIKDNTDERSVRVNEESVNESSELQSGDIVKAREIPLRFQSFCGMSFDWFE